MKGLKKGAKKLIAIILSLAISIPALTISASAKSDIENHWAGNTIKEWMEKGLASGYGDGSFKPDNSITRAEFMNLVNNAFGYSAEAEIQFSDVTEGIWYYNVIQKAVAAGYLGGYPDGTMQPNKLISRQEAAIVIAKVKALTPNTDATMNFTDSSEMASWSNGYIGAVIEAGLMDGYPDGSFKPTAQIKRAEAIVALNHAMRTLIYDKVGTYGPVTGAERIEGNVLVKADGVILQNLIITGSLTIDEGVGQGDVTLNNITVNGETYIRGGGENSIHINGGQYNRIIIQETAGGAVRIVAIDVEGADIVIAEEAAGETIILEGKFDSILLQANQVALQTQGNTEIVSMTVSENIKDSTILVGANTTVTKLSIESPIKVSGDGRIIAVDVKAAGVVFEKAPVEINVTEGIQSPVVENTSNNTGGSSGGRSSAPRTQTITGVLTASAGAPDLSVASIQLKQSGVTVGSVIHPAANGTYSMSGVLAGANYTINVSLEGYYDFTTAAFAVTQGTNITGKDLQVARKEPIITTATLGEYTAISRNTAGLTLTIDLTSGKVYDMQVENLGHTFAEALTVEDVNNWAIDTGTTGLVLDAINRINDTQVEISFTGTASETRAFTIQALDTAITGDYAFDSNVLHFSVVDDGFMNDATGTKQVYYAVNTDVTAMKGVVVLSHGLAEHLGRYNEVVEVLNTAGYGTYRVDHKGHGRTGIQNGDKGIVGAYSEYYEDLDLIVDRAISENPGKPIYMLGHSMGGLIAAMYGVTYPDKLDGQILSGAATGPYYLNFGAEDAFYSQFGGNALYMLPNSLTSTVSRYPAVQNYYFVDPLRLTEFSAQLYWQTFAGGSKYLTDQIDDGQYTYPALIIHGGDDRIVAKAFSESLYNNIDSADKEIVIYDGLFHESLNARNEKSIVMSDIIDWLDARNQSVTGTLTVSAGMPDLTEATLQLKKDNVIVRTPIHPLADGTYDVSGMTVGTGYTVTASLEGYYDFTIAAFEITQGSSVLGKDIQLARKEPIITTQNSTTITKAVSGASIVIDLTSGEDHPAQIINLGHTFAEDATVTNPANWTVLTGTTGLTLESITRNSDTQVTLSFTGDATNARSFSIQADAGAITGPYAFDSNVLSFSVVEDDLIIDATGTKAIYYAKNIEVDGPMKAVVVIVHGLAEHLGRYNETTEALNTAGYGVYRLDNKGHGETGIANGDSGNVEAFAEYYEDIDIIVEMAKADNPGKPVYMIGHSMGGLLTAAYGVTYTDKLAGQIISGGATGPYYMAFGLDDEAFYAAVGGAEALVPNSLTSTVCRYPAIQAYYYVDPLRLTSYTRKLQWETFGAGSKYLEDQITEGNYTYPVFIFHGGDDRIVSKAFSENLYSNISSVDKTLEIYQGLYHESLNERNEKAIVMSDIIDWLNVRID
ncbi:alpha/beta fold hydrolase [Petrocella sp. FN5]|uniref:alpha/beta fold hydrolase n=1 Tax=Petrocella sp. FN5 TaxID=3032002 RepID=UPI0023DCA7DA|nr:alpha/beta fold hydrolase [Petrocella sp. FN5]MDF1618293.1 alpha/beta fold hydrolase [Petrocella sp. FN5]